MLSLSENASHLRLRQPTSHALLLRVTQLKPTVKKTKTTSKFEKQNPHLRLRQLAGHALLLRLAHFGLAGALDLQMTGG